MNPWVVLFGGLGVAILIVSLLDDAPHPPPPDSPPEVLEWHEFLVAHRELRT